MDLVVMLHISVSVERIAGLTRRSCEGSPCAYNAVGSSPNSPYACPFLGKGPPAPQVGRGRPRGLMR